MINYDDLKLSIQNNKFIFNCILLALTIRLTLIIFLSPVPTSDAEFYFLAASKIASGAGYIDMGKGGHLTAYWPVGYPGFLGVLFTLFKPSVFIAQIANLVCSLIILLTTIGIGQQLFSNKSISKIITLILSFYPNYIVYNALLLSETFLTAMLMLGIFLYIKYQTNGMAVLTGFIFGIVVLTKPQFLLIPSLLTFIIFFNRKHKPFLQKILKQFLIVNTVAILTISPWVYRNYIYLHSLVFVSTNGGANLYIGNNPKTTGTYGNFSIKDCNKNGEVLCDKLLTKAALNYIKEHPMQLLQSIPKKFYYLWIKDGEAEYSYQTGYEPYKHRYMAFRIIRVINQIYYGLVMALAFWGAFLILKNKEYKKNTLLLFGMSEFIYISIVYSLFFGESRFHFPVMPLLIVYSSYAIASIIAHYRKQTPILITPYRYTGQNH